MCDCKVEKDRLWIIEFNVSGQGKGCAVVKAKGPAEAERILVSEGTFNGTPLLYGITRVEEIIESPAPMLICEQIL